jgi:hypothetical protein
MDQEIIDLYPGSQAQRWLIVHASGKITLHCRYDDYEGLRYGYDPTGIEVSLDEIRQRAAYVADEVERALVRLRGRAAVSSSNSEEKENMS